MISAQVSIPGYQVTEELYNGSRTLVYRGYRETDLLPVVIKLLKNPYPSFSELMQFRNQYTIAKNLNSPNIIQTYGLEAYQNGYGLVMEDFGGISLKDYFANNNDVASLQEFLQIAIALCNTLDILYRNCTIHKDIKPSNILINPETKQVKLIDFSIASLLPRETQEIKNVNTLEGTLAYLSPEQTGRMNRGIDYRSDFYSLGVTFYELLTGKLPFISDDPMELVHCHLAKIPILVHQLSPEVPLVFAEIISKLMAKNAEDRYQSALGIKHDLEICLNQLQATRNIESFAIGEGDISDRFTIPEKLYGREKQVEELLQAFERVSAGNSEMVLVAGFSGIGKTAVVNEVHKPIVKQRGYFIKGKFDQFNRNIPFSAFVEAFRDLMGQLLAESDTQIQQWKSHIIQALGDNAQVIIDVIPELERIIGQQSPATELSGSAAQNRFNLLFQNFLQLFTNKEHPLVIFLDDLQWADSASLQLIQLLIGDGNQRYLLLIGAYRDNEVSPTHPLMLTLDGINKAGAIVNTLTLQPLSQLKLNQLVADTLKCAEDLAFYLSELIHQKTQGNPFFATQFLKSLHQDRLIKFNWEDRCWQCDISRINQQALTDDVVEFMVFQLRRLPESTQEVLKLAACIGNQFDLQTLAIVSEQSQVEAAASLWPALQSDLILPQSEVYKFYQDSGEQTQFKISDRPIAQYKFLHDRVQQAAYSMIPEEEKQKTHFKIGQLLLQGLSQQEQKERIFDLVNQLNLGQVAIATHEQKKQLARFNLQAGQKAKLSAAYQASHNYCTIGIGLLPTTTWQTDYELIYSLHRDSSETAYLCGDFERAEILYGEALSHARTPLDKAVIYRVRMTQYQLQGRNAEAIAIQRQSLQLLGWEMPIEQEFIQVSLDAEIAIVNRFLEQQTVESILNLPKMEDDNIAEILRILQILFYAAWLDGQPTLALLALAKMTTLSLEYGNSDMSPFGYVGYGLIANAMLKDMGTAHQFGEMAVQLCEQFDNADVQGMTNFLFAADVHSWSRPIRQADTYYENAYKYGMEAGNWLTVSFMMMQSGSDRLTYGKNLDELYAIAQTHADFLRHIKSLENLDALIVGVIQPIRNLLGLTKTPFSFDDDSFSESEYLQKYNHAPYHLAWLYSVKIRHAYLFDYKTAYPDLISKLSIIENTISSHAKVPSSVFYVALMHLALAEISQHKEDHQFHLQSVILLEEKLNNWQTACLENILHKCLLIKAEKARLHRQKTEAIEFYEEAITTAQTNEYGYEEALANELAAKFYLDWGKEKVAAGYMQEAYYCYARWGAKAKVNHLEKTYPQLLKPILQQQRINLKHDETLSFRGASSSTRTSTTGNTSISDVLDFSSILKAAQTISRSIELDELVTSLTQIILENSGAKKSVLILPQSDIWQVRAITLINHQAQIQTILRPQLVDTCQDIPRKIINYVKNTQETIVIDNCQTDIPGVIGKYMLEHQPKSALCTPIINQGHLVGILYLENQITSGVFNQESLQVTNLLCIQAAISLENAQLFTQQQEKIQEIAQKEAEYRSIFDSVNDGLSICDLETGKTIATNPTNSQMHGYSQEEWLHLNPQDFIHSDYMHLFSNYLETLRAGKEFYAQAIDKRKDGSLFDVEVKAVPFFYKGKLHGLTILRDISEQQAALRERQKAEAIVIHKSQELELTLQDLQQAQLQIIQSEKMSALGNLVAGVAHEMNNPLGFISATLKQAKPAIADITEHLKLYQESLENPRDQIKDHAEEIDLDYSLEDLPKMIDAMVMACDRLKNISTSLRTFSRADKDYKVLFNIHEGINSTILILKHRLKANEARPAIEVVTEYGNLPKIECFAGQLNQVFMNIIANAIDALDEFNNGRRFEEINANPNRIKITTLMEYNSVKITISDNGNGMNEEVKEKIFDHLFTTKAVGKGTGLGLAIARQIVEKNHGGKLKCHSILGTGTEFIIDIPVSNQM